MVETVIAQLNLDLTYEQFLKKLTVTTQNDTRILSITVKDEDPYMASQIADAIRVAAADHIPVSYTHLDVYKRQPLTHGR